MRPLEGLATKAGTAAYRARVAATTVPARPDRYLAQTYLQPGRGLSPVIAEFLPGLETDAQRAVQFARSTPGVGTALVGMQRIAHVEENARLGRVPPLPWNRFQRLFQGEESA